MPLASPADRVQAYVTELTHTWKQLRSGRNSVRSVHRARVLTRRLDAVYRLNRSLRQNKRYRRLKRANKNMRKRLGCVRELDIHIKQWKALVNSESYAHEVLRHMKKHRQRNLEGFIKRKRFKIFLRTAQQLKRHQVDDVVFKQQELADSLLCHVRQIFQYDHSYKATFDHNYIHQERLATKKMRYDLEEVQLLMGADYRQAVAVLKAIQDELGSINDLETFYQYLHFMRRIKRHKLSSEACKGLKRVATHIQAVRDLCVKEWERNWSARKSQLVDIEKGLSRLKAA